MPLPVERLTAYQKIENALAQGRTPVYLSGAAPVHKAQIIHALAAHRGTGAVVVTADEAAAARLAEEINLYARQELAVQYPERELTLRPVEGVSLEYEHLRLTALARRLHDPRCILVASADAAAQPTMPPEVLRDSITRIAQGDAMKPESLLVTLLWAGYTRAEQVEGVCQFASRGGIVDFFPPRAAAPVRVEFWGDEIDTINSFSLETQRREETLPAVEITPARELLCTTEQLRGLLQKHYDSLTEKQRARCGAELLSDLSRLSEGLELPSADRYLPLIYPQQASLFSYVGEGLLVLCEGAAVRDTLEHTAWQQGQDADAQLESGELSPGCAALSLTWGAVEALCQKQPTLLLDAFRRSYPGLPLGEAAELRAGTLSPWSGVLDTLVEDLQGYLADGWCCQMLAGTRRGALSLTTDLAGRGLPAVFSEDRGAYAPGQIFVLEGTLSAGYEYPEIKLAVETYHKGQSAALGAKKKRPRRTGKALRDIADLSPGDYVVHATHGIGVFQGIIKRESLGVVKDYIKIQYAGTDTLFVPVTQLDLVTKYVGGKEENIRLSRLNSAEWSKTRSRVKKEVSDMAKELIALYAKRSTAQGFAFSEDGDWQREFEQKFEYEETDDQLRCIAEIKQDMEHAAPMDRLLCGDVGFGKTEVALRAVFKCVLDGKQCAVMVPTTILAWQHYQTFQRRFEGTPVSVELLSRFRTAKEQKEILRRLAAGTIDVVIGTHRLVQEDVRFRDLGLCVIDEEQRFGVAAKERFKQMRANIDVLTLSATPIPRTLNMAMSGIRDMSVIDEAPQDRHPVQTYVMEYDEALIAEAIRKELRRGGQVFYLHNRIESIAACAARIQEMAPEARIAVGHGRMGEDALSEVWRRLVEREADILVCTTIIEAGVDVPNCNTLIIEDADRMGLSQLYQLRGRVGRSDRRAYAYFTFRRGRVVSEVAEKRLEAIREFTAFGSGFRIAMRDLEIRGAGDILGAAQHGNMEAVGYDLYLKLLSDAIAAEKGEAPQQDTECLVDIQMQAHIPEEYIASLSQRIDIYKKIAAIYTPEDYSDTLDELIDRFGEPPEAVVGLLSVALVRGRAARLGIYEIDQRGAGLIFKTDRLNKERVVSLTRALPGRVLVNAGAKPYVTIRPARGEKPLDTINATLAAMEASADPGPAA